MSEVSLHKLFSDEPEFGDFFSLLKPRVMSLVVFTAIAGLLAAPGNIQPYSIDNNVKEYRERQ